MTRPPETLRGIRVLGHQGPHGGPTWAAVDSSGRQVAMVFVPPQADQGFVNAALEMLLNALDPAPQLSVSRGGTSGASAGREAGATGLRLT